MSAGIVRARKAQKKHERRLETRQKYFMREENGATIIDKDRPVAYCCKLGCERRAGMKVLGREYCRPHGHAFMKDQLQKIRRVTYWDGCIVHEDES